MRRIWVTRSEPGAGRLACAVREAGFEVVVEPVLEIVASGRPAPSGYFDGAVFVSEHAAGFAGRIDLAEGAAIVAIGHATTVPLLRQGLKATVVERSSDALIERWRTSPSLIGLSRVVLAKGEGGRRTLPDELRKHAELVVWDAYRRAAKNVASPPSLDAIVCSSGDGVRAMSRTYSGQTDVPVIVPSARVAAIALELGYSDTHISNGATPAAVVLCLRGLVRRKRDG